MKKRSEMIQRQIDWTERDLQLGNITHSEYVRITQSLLDDKAKALKEEADE